MRIAVLGGGIAGCVAARELANDSRFQIDLIERANRLGGLHHSPEIDGDLYDIGAFFFDDAHGIFRTFPDLRKHFVPFPVSALTVSEGGGFDRYPVTMKGYVRNHGLAHFAAAMADLAWAKIRDRRRDTVASFARYYLGGIVFERSGLRAYIERLYGLGIAEVDMRFARQRMGDLSRWASLRGIAARALTRPSAIWGGRYYPSVALARPRGGFQEAYAFIESELARCGVSVTKGCAIRDIRCEGSGFRLLFDDGSATYDRVVSTIPLATTGRLLGLMLSHRFETVSLLTLFYRFDGDPGYDAAQLSNFTRCGNWKRIVDFSHYYGGPHRLSVEVTTGSDAEAGAAAFEEHVKGLGLFRGWLILKGHAVTPNAYPIYRAEGIERLTQDIAAVSATGIVLAGRQGQFDYISSDQAARGAAEAAKSILAEAAGADLIAA